MTAWEIPVTYKGKVYNLASTVVYKSTQIIRINVEGSKSSLLLENNYPAIRFANAKKGVKWKIRSGSIAFGGTDHSRLLMDILEKLEYVLKKDFKELFPDYTGS